MKSKQGGFVLFLSILPALIGMGVLTAGALNGIPAPTKAAQVQTQYGPVVSASGTVSTN